MPPTTRNSQFTTRNSLDLYRLLLWLAITSYTALFTWLAWDLHNGMRTHRSDLGQIAQAIWNSSRGRFLEMTDNGFVATRLTDHVEPLLVLISPILWLWEDVRVLLFLQVILVAVGAWPLYELALRRLDTLLTPRQRTQIWEVESLRQMTRPLALALAIGYLLTPPLQSAVLTEFHAVPLAVPLILWAFWAIDAHRPYQVIIATLLVAVTKEEMALLAAGLAAWALWRNWVEGRRQETGDGRQGTRDVPPATYHLPPATCYLLLTILCLLWFYVATFVIVPAYAVQVYETGQSVYFERYGALGDSPLDIAKSFVTQPKVVWQIAMEPARRGYLWALLVPFGLLSLLAPEILLLTLPLLLANLLSAYPAQYYSEFHYSAPLVPYIGVSATYGLTRLWCWLGRRASGTSASYQHAAAAKAWVMALVSLVTNARSTLRPLLALLLILWLLTWSLVGYRDAGRGPWGGRYDPVLDPPLVEAHQQLLPYFLAQIPDNAAVTATAAVHPHLSLRQFVYQFPLGVPMLGTAGDAEWALLDVTTNTDMAPGDLKSAVETMLAGDWGVVDGSNGFLLLHRGHATKEIPAAFYDFARTPQQERATTNASPSPTQLWATSATTWPRWRQTKVTAEWIVGSDVQTNPPQPQLDIVSPEGELLYNLITAAPPALVWYPPVRWQPGDHVRATTLALFLPRVWGIVTDNAVQTTIASQDAEDGRRALVALFYHEAAGEIVRVPLSASATLPPPDLVTPYHPTRMQFLNENQEEMLALQVWGTKGAVRPGQSLLLWLRWQGEQWPEGKTAFVHLRINGQNIVQRDGLPRFFRNDQPITLLAQRGVLDDTRVLVLPEDLAPGTALSLVVGLYDLVTGERSAIRDAMGTPIGTEWRVRNFALASPLVPDQACVMIPVTCAAQQ